MMLKKSDHYLYVLIIIIIILFSAKQMMVNKELDNENVGLNKEVLLLKHYLIESSSYYLKEFPNLRLASLETDSKYNIKDLIVENTLFLFFKYSDCAPCYENELVRFSKIQNKLKGLELNIVAMDSNPRSVLTLCEKYHLSYDHLFLLDIDEIGKFPFQTPCYLEFSAEGQVLSKFRPDKQFSELSVSYLKQVKTMDAIKF